MQKYVIPLLPYTKICGTRSTLSEENVIVRASPCDAEIADFHLLITSQKSVFWFQISVYNVVFVKKLSIIHIVI